LLPEAQNDTRKGIKSGPEHLLEACILAFTAKNNHDDHREP
jgi:hypothetical protein